MIDRDAAPKADAVRTGDADRAGDTARSVALEAIGRIESSTAYANLALGPILERSSLDDRDKRLATELVYGSIRRKGSCDYLVDRFLTSEPPADVRNVLRLGAYQLEFMDIPDHAAVSATVELAGQRYRGLVNAVLRRVATAPVEWPDSATRLSFPSWIVDVYLEEFGPDLGEAALASMNVAPKISVRPDGYVQDEASQLVASLVTPEPGDVVADLCAAPGGKATAVARDGVRVVAADRKLSRARLITSNSERLGLDSVLAVVADARKPALREQSAQWVVVDAPCSGLGVLRRRADARWRIQPGDVERLAELQEQILHGAAGLVSRNGTLLYSVCTVTRRESVEVAERFQEAHPEFEPLPLNAPWREWGSGGIVLPHEQDSDGMCAFMWSRREG